MSTDRSGATRTAVRVGRDGRGHAHGLRSHRRHRRQTEDHGGWGIAPMAAFGFGLLVHWTTLDEQIAGLRRHAFDVREILAAPDGRRLAAKDDTSDVEWFQVLATKDDGVPLRNA